MSSYDPETPSPNETYWSLWRGLDTLVSHPKVLSVSQVGEENIQGSENPIKSETISEAVSFPNTSQRRCMVPGCPSLNCNLGTHQKYNPRPSNQTQSHKKLERRAYIAMTQLAAYKQGSPSTDGVDGFPTLPLEESLDPTVRSLFHFFFMETFDWLALLFRGPSVTNMHYFKQRMLGTALKSEVYCRSLILQARIVQDKAGHFHEETKGSLTLQNGTIKAFREQLKSIQQNQHPLQIELALLVFCILIVYSNTYGNEEAERLHWQGMRDLVAMRGGMHCVTMALAYVIHVDRVCATRLEVLPTYTNTLAQSLPMPIPPPGSSTYGSYLHVLKRHPTTINHVVVDYLIDVSKLVELWEERSLYAAANLSHGHRTSLEYLHYTRDRLDEQFTILNAQWAKTDSVERCLLWTSRIVEYPCTWADYFGTMTRHLCHKLATALQQYHHLIEEWQSGLNVLAWMLFALTMVDHCDHPHSWAMERLQEIFRVKYGSVPWQRTWRAHEQANLLNFVWSSSHYTDRFRRVCDQLEKQSHDIADIKHRSDSEERKPNP